MPAPELALGVLTRASDAHLNALPAFLGLSVSRTRTSPRKWKESWECESGTQCWRLQETAVSPCTESLAGTHVDLDPGWLYFLVAGKFLRGGTRH
jgi:hypothetical protein